MEGVPALDWEEYRGDIPFYRHAIAGASAGVAEHIAMFPLDTVKTRLQAYDGALHRKSFSEIVKTIMNERGIYGFVRGWSAIAIGCIPAHIALFTVYENSKLFLMTRSQSNSLSTRDALICGSLSTFAHDAILTPMDVAKQRLQLGCYSSLSNCIKTLISKEGVASLFRSLPTTLAMNAPYGAVFVACNEQFKELISNNNDIKSYFIAAGMAASIASVTTHPLDVIKTRLQTQDVLCGKNVGCTLQKNRPNTQIKYPSFRVAMPTIWKEEGLRGFYRGLLPRALLSIPGAATCWGTYESVKRLLANIDL
jgi:solute carrier family 25 (mitochondrial iron transporter), member 28/37